MGPHGVQVVVGVMETMGELVEHVSYASNAKDVVRKDECKDARGTHEDGPRPHDETDQHHGEWASLRYAAFPLVREPHASGQPVVQEEVLDEVFVSSEDPHRHASVPSDGIYDGASDLAVELRDVKHPTTERGCV